MLYILLSIATVQIALIIIALSIYQNTAPKKLKSLEYITKTFNKPIVKNPVSIISPFKKKVNDQIIKSITSKE